jgi:hypothetical protein
MGTAARRATGAALVGLLALMLIPAIASASLPSSAPAHSSTTAPVFIHFKPKSASGVQGGTVSVTIIVHNNGSSSFNATSCSLWYRFGVSGAWTAGKCGSSASFPDVLKAHSHQKFKESQKVSSTFPTGTYEWKIQVTGTYHGRTENSHPGILKVTIT